ncbi:hypothetical protein BGZ60DRAFT_527620 [Tricladium varicosporioides]|nr:hypothetical protein BGZ60DRAFT_527620 [Hymenoscyphus varicosporioides]
MVLTPFIVPHDPNKTPTKRPHFKSKNGCAICRARRVKCDEEKPICKRCSLGPWTCSYVHNVPKIRRKSTKGSSLTTEVPSTPDLQVPSFIETPLTPMGLSGEDARCYDYFRTVMVRKISGFFETEFFDKILLQLSYSEPAIWHALLAFAAFASPEEYFLPGGTSAVPIFSRRFALDHYYKALRHLTGRMSQRQLPVEVILTACFAFSGLELVFKNVEGALAHLQSGFRVMYTWKATNTRHNVTIDTYLTPIFQDFILAALIYGSTMLPTGKYTYQPHLGQRPSFMSISEARISLLEILRYGLDSARAFEVEKVTENFTQPSTMTSSHKLHFECCIQTWTRNFKALIDSPQSSSFIAKDIHMINILKFQQKLASIYIPMRFEMEEGKFDNHFLDFEDLLDTADALYQSEINSGPSEKRCKDLTFLAMHFSQLFVIITKCRNPLLRHRGLAVLKSLPYSKDIWTRKLMTKVAERAIEIEEAGSESMGNAFGIVVPPEEARVHDINIISEMVGDPKKCVVQFRQRKNGEWIHRDEEFIV